MNIIIISVLVLLALLIFGRNIFFLLIFTCLIPVGLVFYILSYAICIIGQPRNPWGINQRLGNVLYYLFNK